MALLVMCGEKIRRLLHIIFVTIFAWVYAWPWPGCLWIALRTIRETLENPAHLRENRPVMAGMDWVDGKQAAWLR
jgi:hypothetical protein